MHLVEERTSNDGNVVAKIYDDVGTYVAECYVGGNLKKSMIFEDEVTLQDAVRRAEQWVGTVQSLNE